MAPSRGFSHAFRLRVNPKWSCRRQFASLTSVATNLANQTQIYLSRSLDPYLNLSIEHYLLQKTPTESTVLFLYTNRKCIVIGRNQNPWVEINLRLAKGLDDPASAVELVRRRSGGGTVFHDEGNMNYSVICPTSEFDRDKHAEMVVRALKKLGVQQAKVNERHDIVLEPARASKKAIESANLSRIGTDSSNDEPAAAIRPLKVSGSAYKLTRLRSLHHGTCLLSSPNLSTISNYLRSPARHFIKARGVDSVSSPITNVNLTNTAFERAVVHEFGEMYGAADAHVVAQEAEDIPEVMKGVKELKSLEWLYGQTPQFTFASHPTEDDARKRPFLPNYLPPDFHLEFTARNAAIVESNVSVGPKSLSYLHQSLVDRKLHEIEDWESLFTAANAPKELGTWMQSIM